MKLTNLCNNSKHLLEGKVFTNGQAHKNFRKLLVKFCFKDFLLQIVIAVGLFANNIHCTKCFGDVSV